MPVDFQSLPVAVNLAGSAFAAVAIWKVGTKLSRYADVISHRTAIDRAFVGLVLLAFATSLPELATTTSASVIGRPALAVNNLIAGIVVQTAVLALADVAAGRRPLTYLARHAGTLLQAAMLIILLGLALVIAVAGDIALPIDIGLFTAGLFVGYLAIAFLRQRQAGGTSWEPVVPPEEHEQAERLRAEEDRQQSHHSTPAVFGLFALGGLGVLVAGTALTHTADALSVQLELSASLVGATLLAASTSLPEVSTTVGAIRIGAPGMAMGNIFGSNMLMVAFLPIADLFYREGLIIEHVGPVERFTLAMGIVVTAVYLVGLIWRNSRVIWRLGPDSLVVVLLAAVTLGGIYVLG